MASTVDIANRALQILGQSSIASLTDDSDRAREMNRAYEPVRDAELRTHVWNFARSRASLAASSTTPSFGYSYAYPLPSDFIRLHPQTSSKDWQIEYHNGRVAILTNDGAPLKIIYIAKVTDPNFYDPLFREVLSAKIAYETAQRLVQPTVNELLEYKQRYDDAIATAKRVNAIERVSAQPPEDDWVRVRRNGYVLEGSWNDGTR